MYLSGDDQCTDKVLHAEEVTIVDVDNGDPASHEPFQANHRRAFNSLCLAIIQAATTPGAIQVTANAPGMTAASIVVQAR